jgi:bisphosphoglycerate-independent phosphoglycerate mutase (AlkP superfamily)
MPKNRPLVLTILDGWGYRPESFANAIAQARKPNYDRLLAEFPNTLLHASDHFVGLPDGQMGNSEVGHLNIGAGRVVHMDITRIDTAIENGSIPCWWRLCTRRHPRDARCICSACSRTAACTRISVTFTHCSG